MSARSTKKTCQMINAKKLRLVMSKSDANLFRAMTGFGDKPSAEVMPREKEARKKLNVRTLFYFEKDGG